MEVNNFLSEFKPVVIDIPGVRLPKITIEDSIKKQLKLNLNCTNYDVLRTLIKDGFNKLNLQKGSEEYKKYGERIKYELNIVNELGFTDYFLLVWKVINFCKENNIPTGAARGSAAGSVVLNLIGVTNIDPVKHGLYFERFISKARAKKNIVDGIIYFSGELLPDCDLDICYYRRKEVIKYLNNQFDNQTARILTFNTLSSKLAIKEVGKVLGILSEEEMTEITSLIPKIHGTLSSLEEVYKENKQFQEWADKNKKVYETSLKLVDLIKNPGNHPSGIMICYDKLENSCPVQLTSDKEIISSYDMDWVSTFSIKLDILGLQSVSVLYDACKNLNINYQDINLDDPEIYKNLYDLKYPHGLFQLETQLGTQICQKVKPKNLHELSAVVALNRPGAMQFVDKYANYTNTGTYESIHPFFDEILKETGGTCLYQEEGLKMMNKLGFTLDECEIVRRVIGKKKIEEMAIWKDKIFEKCKQQNLSEEIGKILWKIMDDSKSYSFNMCLSPDTVIETLDGNRMMYEINIGNKIKAYDTNNNKDHYVDVINKFKNKVELYEVELEDGRKIKCSMKHKFLCEDLKMYSLEEIILHKHKIMCNI